MKKGDDQPTMRGIVSLWQSFTPWNRRLGVLLSLGKRDLCPTKPG